jgi:hypothetical protein
VSAILLHHHGRNVQQLQTFIGTVLQATVGRGEVIGKTERDNLNEKICGVS